MFDVVKAYNYNTEHYNSSENDKKRSNTYSQWFSNDFLKNNDKRKYLIVK